MLLIDHMLSQSEATLSLRLQSTKPDQFPRLRGQASFVILTRDFDKGPRTRQSWVGRLLFDLCGEHDVQGFADA